MESEHYFEKRDIPKVDQPGTGVDVFDYLKKNAKRIHSLWSSGEGGVISIRKIASGDMRSRAFIRPMYAQRWHWDYNLGPKGVLLIDPFHINGRSNTEASSLPTVARIVREELRPYEEALKPLVEDAADNLMVKRFLAGKYTSADEELSDLQMLMIYAGMLEEGEKTVADTIQARIPVEASHSWGPEPSAALFSPYFAHRSGPVPGEGEGKNLYRILIGMKDDHLWYFNKSGEVVKLFV